MQNPLHQSVHATRHTTKEMCAASKTTHQCTPGMLNQALRVDCWRRWRVRHLAPAAHNSFADRWQMTSRRDCPCKLRELLGTNAARPRRPQLKTARHGTGRLTAALECGPTTNCECGGLWQNGASTKRGEGGGGGRTRRALLSAQQRRGAQYLLRDSFGRASSRAS